MGWPGLTQTSQGRGVLQPRALLLQLEPLGKNKVTSLGNMGHSWFCPPSAFFGSEELLVLVTTIWGLWPRGHLWSPPFPTEFSPYLGVSCLCFPGPGPLQRSSVGHA